MESLFSKMNKTMGHHRESFNVNDDLAWTTGFARPYHIYFEKTILLSSSFYDLENYY